MRYVVLGALLVIGCGSHKVTKEKPVVSINKRDPKPRELRKRIAVCEFADKTAYGKERLGSGASDVLQTMLWESQQFILLDREQLSKALEEQKLAGSGVVDASTAARVGKVIGAAYVVYGSVTNFGCKAEWVNVLGVRTKKWIAESTVDVRVTNTETSEICYMNTGRGKATSTTTRFLGQGKTETWDERLPGESLRAAIAEMIDALMDHCP